MSTVYSASSDRLPFSGAGCFTADAFSAPRGTLPEEGRRGKRLPVVRGGRRTQWQRRAVSDILTLWPRVRHLHPANRPLTVDSLRATVAGTGRGRA
ncbi:hypothetical protein ACUSIJ_22250 [Pseudochelatococcus sp. B33]